MATGYRNHRSVRNYTNEKITDELLQDIFAAGIRASTTGNMQLYSVVVTRDDNMKKKLAPCHFNQSMVLQAPVLLTFCADINRFSQWCTYSDADPGYNNFLWFINATIDVLLVAQNMCVAAEEKGLGICYLGTTLYTAEKIIDILSLPRGVFPVTAVVMGYAADKAPLTDRLPMEAVIHYEKYNNYTADDIRRFYAAKEALPSTLDLLKQNNKQRLAQVFTDNRYKKEDNIKYSEELIRVLRKQGFVQS